MSARTAPSPHGTLRPLVTAFIAVLVASALLSWFVIVVREATLRGQEMRRQQQLTGHIGPQPQTKVVPPSPKKAAREVAVAQR